MKIYSVYDPEFKPYGQIIDGMEEVCAQIVNVLNIPLEIPVSEQGPGMGAAMLAMVACGEYPSVQAVCDRFVEVASRVEPEPGLVAKYEKRYKQFRKIYPACKGLFAEFMTE